MKHLFLDLEDTIITPVTSGWFRTELINVEKIKRVIKEFSPDYVNIFSFAIWDTRELKNFNEGTRPMIESALDVRLNLVPTVDDHIIPWCCRIGKINPSTVDFSEMSAFWGKQDTFRLSMRTLHEETFKNWGHAVDVLLLDDSVIDEEFSWPKLHIKGRILNIDELP